MNAVIDVNGYYTTTSLRDLDARVSAFDGHTHDDRYYTTNQSNDRYYTKTEVDAVVLEASEVIATPGRALPATLVDEGPSAVTAETVTSSVAGRWLVSKTVRLYMSCPTTQPYFFLMIDGVPVRSSVVITLSGQFATMTLVGTSEDPIPAGDHTIAVGADCDGENQIGDGAFFATAGSVTVLR